MSDLDESPVYDPGVYQIETNDLVVGGPTGIANKGNVNLANRTTWLKQQVDNLNDFISGGESFLTREEADALYAILAHVHPNASEVISGFIELATINEVKAGTDTLRAVTPAGLHGLNKSFGSAGYATMPGGLIIQWAVHPGSTYVAWPITFPVTVFRAMAIDDDAPYAAPGIQSMDKSGIILAGDTNSVIALGY